MGRVRREALRSLTGPTPNLKPTLASIQSEIFAPIVRRSRACCHTGNGRFLPGVMNLTEGNAYANLVGVASIQKPCLQRVIPGDPDEQLPASTRSKAAPASPARACRLNGTPYLTDGQILVIQRWIEIGAPNN